MHKRLLILGLLLIATAHALRAQTTGNPLARFHTDLGDIDVVLLQNVAPKTVANFFHYVNRASGAYNNSFIHRSALGFVVQGGGYKWVNNQATLIPTDAPVVNEFHASNLRGTIAMAKLPNDPNSATDEWYFNLSDGNAPNLDTQNGGFTVFGNIINAAGLATMDAIAGVPDYNVAPFDSWPLRNYTSGAVQDANLVHVIWVKQIPQVNALTHPSANTVHVQGKGSASVAYQLQSASTPAAASFANLTMVTADSSGNISYNDTSAGSKKFYRFTIP